MENQRYDINKYCGEHHMEVGQWYEETISGAKDYHKRILNRLIRKAKKGGTYDDSDASQF